MTEQTPRTSLYTRLFTYRERDGQKPLENFLTEALADVLNRLPPVELREFIAGLLLPTGASFSWLDDLAQGNNARLWKTQVQADFGGDRNRPDLVFYVDAKPVVVVEVKVDAALGGGSKRAARGIGDAHPARAAEPDESGPAIDQLDRYGRWLCSAAANEREAVLVLLSRSTEAPGRLREKARATAPCWRHTRWHEVWRWLRAHGRSPADAPGPSWKDLCAELADFLEERNMSSEFMSPHDLAAVQVAIGSVDRVANTFDRVGKAVKQELGELAVQGTPGLDYKSEGGVIIGWLYLRKPQKGYWSINWGIRFPEVGSWWKDMNLPDADRVHAYVLLAHERGNGPLLDKLPKGKLPQGWWTSADNELVAIQPLHQFPAAPEDLASELTSWTRGKVAEIKALLPHIIPT